MQRQIYEYHPIIGHRFIPGIAARLPHEGGGYLIRTNQAGFRCEHEVIPEKLPRSFRILLFGDSFTAGDGVSNQYRYGDLIEKHFGRLQILNFGLSGTGTDQQYLIFREFAKNLEYDLLMIGLLVENIRRVISRYRLAISRESGEVGYLAKPYFERVNDTLVLQHVPVPKGILNKKDLPPEELQYVDYEGPHPALRTLVSTYLNPFKPIIQAVSKYQPVPHYDALDDPAWLLMTAILKQWISENGQRPVLICPLPMYHHVEQTASAKNYQKRFQELATELDQVTVSDPLPRFWAETLDNRRRCRFTHDPHLTPYGHKILAEALAPAIAQFLGEDEP